MIVGSLRRGILTGSPVGYAPCAIVQTLQRLLVVVLPFRPPPPKATATQPAPGQLRNWSEPAMSALPRMAPPVGPPIANGEWGLFAVTMAVASIWTMRAAVPVMDVSTPRDLN